MIFLHNYDTNAMIGSITESDLKRLIDVLEKEPTTDQTYYVDLATIDVIGEGGAATNHLLGLLRTAAGSAAGVNFRWKRR